MRTDSIVETFDQPLNGGGAGLPNFIPTDLGYYQANGNQVFAAGGGTFVNGVPAIQQEPGRRRADLAELPTGNDGLTAVGGFALQGAVLSSNETPFHTFPVNLADALGASNPATTSLAPGSIAAPQVTNALILSASNQFGVASNSLLLTWSMNLLGTFAAVPGKHPSSLTQTVRR